MDMGTEVDGTIERAELVDDEGNIPFYEGEELELYVVALGENEIRLSKAISGIGGFDILIMPRGFETAKDFSSVHS